MVMWTRHDKTVLSLVFLSQYQTKTHFSSVFTHLASETFHGYLPAGKLKFIEDVGMWEKFDSSVDGRGYH